MTALRRAITPPETPHAKASTPPTDPRIHVMQTSALAASATSGRGRGYRVAWSVVPDVIDPSGDFRLAAHRLARTLGFAGFEYVRGSAAKDSAVRRAQRSLAIGERKVRQNRLGARTLVELAHEAKRGPHK